MPEGVCLRVCGKRIASSNKTTIHRQAAQNTRRKLHHIQTKLLQTSTASSETHTGHPHSDLGLARPPRTKQTLFQRPILSTPYVHTTLPLGYVRRAKTTSDSPMQHIRNSGGSRRGGRQPNARRKHDHQRHDYKSNQTSEALKKTTHLSSERPPPRRGGRPSGVELVGYPQPFFVQGPERTAAKSPDTLSTCA